MADDDDLDYIVKNSQRVLKLNDEYEIIYMLTNLQKNVMLGLYIERTF